MFSVRGEPDGASRSSRIEFSLFFNESTRSPTGLLQEPTADPEHPRTRTCTCVHVYLHEWKQASTGGTGVPGDPVSRKRTKGPEGDGEEGRRTKNEKRARVSGATIRLERRNSSVRRGKERRRSVQSGKLKFPSFRRRKKPTYPFPRLENQPRNTSDAFVSNRA